MTNEAAGVVQTLDDGNGGVITIFRGTDGCIVVSPLNPDTLRRVPWAALGFTAADMQYLERYEQDTIFGDYQCG